MNIENLFIKRGKLVHKTTGREVGMMRGNKLKVCLEGKYWDYEDVVTAVMHNARATPSPGHYTTVSGRRVEIWRTDCMQPCPILGVIEDPKGWLPCHWHQDGTHPDPELNLTTEVSI